MNPFGVEALGLVAGSLTTCSFVPQVVRTWRSRSVEDISFRMYLLLSAGILLWMVYGVLVGSLSIIVANGVSLGLSLAILAMKIVYRKKS